MKKAAKKIDILFPDNDKKLSPQLKNKKHSFHKYFLTILLLILSGILSYFNVDLNIKVSDLENQEAVEISVDNKPNIELSEDQDIKAKIETSTKTVLLDVPVVESLDGGQLQIEESGLDFGKGEFYPFDTPEAFKNATINKCIDLDGKWGAQCVDLAAVFWKEYANRWISTCNTGIAKGIWSCKEQNAGDEFELITDTSKLQPGDFIVFNTGENGHIGMALGSENKGYIALLGENQGGKECAGGGSATNIININLKGFLGAFRPKIYIHPKAPDTGIKPDFM
jgi:hypothetical protein